MRAQDNELMTRIGPGTPCGELLRRYWHPVALLDEFDPALDARMADRPVKALRVLGQDLVLFKDATGRFGLLDRACAHRGADLSFARFEGDGLRCPFHGWKFAADGACLDTPAEPEGSRLCQSVRARHYPLVQRCGVLFAWLGAPDTTPPPLPTLDCFSAPASHSFAFKGLWRANWLQAVEVGIDPAHPSFLHRFLFDEPLDAVGDNAAGKQFRSASAGAFDGQAWPMTRIMREFHKPLIEHQATPYGFEITTRRPLNAQWTHVRVTQSLFPVTFVIPLSPTMTITQMHLPVDDTHTYWYSFFTSYAGPLDQQAMRAQRLRFIDLPDYTPKAGRHNHWGFNAQEQRERTFLGMGEDDINVHDQWAVESMGAIQDRSRERLGSSDKVIIANRRLLLSAIESVQAGGAAPGVAEAATALACQALGTVDGIAPAEQWQGWWREQVQAKHAGAPWTNSGHTVGAARAA